MCRQRPRRDGRRTRPGLPRQRRRGRRGFYSWLPQGTWKHHRPIDFMDAYAGEQAIGSRPAVVHKSVRLLRAVEHSDDCRPAVIVSNGGANTTPTRLGRGDVTVAPVTSNVDRVYPFQVLLPAELTGLTVDSKA